MNTSGKWLVLAAVAASTILATIDASIVDVALPILVKHLDSSFGVIQWVAQGFLLTIATFSLSVGRLGDILGRKKLYVSGLTVFTVASMFCGMAPAVSWLIGLRVLQASGAVMVVALGAAILVGAFPAKERGKALGWDRCPPSTWVWGKSSHRHPAARPNLRRRHPRIDLGPPRSPRCRQLHCHRQGRLAPIRSLRQPVSTPRSPSPESSSSLGRGKHLDTARRRTDLNHCCS